MISKQEQAEFLAEAMPYIKKYNDKILVIKYGGNAMINEELKASVMRDLVLLQLVGIKVVLVHGGGPDISEMLKRLGIESKFVNGLRYTDAETAEVVRMVLAGKINKALVNQLEACGGKAVGISGIDGHMLGCEKENEQLDTDVRRERQKALDSRFELGRLQEQTRRLEQKLARIPPEILAQYSKSTSRQEKNRHSQPFL